MATAVLAASAAALAAGPQSINLSGRYEGTSTGSNGSVSVGMELKQDGGSITGSIWTSEVSISVTSGALKGDELTLQMDMQGTVGSFTGRLTNERIEGDWSLAGDTGSVVFTREAPAIAGHWDGMADTPDGSVSFWLKLAVDGETVTGESGSDAGSTPLTGGTWKTGVLTVSLMRPEGAPVTMTGKIEGAELVGTYDYNRGEAAGPWRARKRASP